MAVLGSPARRTTTPPYSSRVSSTLKRRIVLGVLVVVSLALITGYFRESNTGVLHGAQSAGATILRPFEVGAERVAAPFRDAYRWFHGLVDARARARRLQAEVDQLRQKAIQYQGAAAENAVLRKQLGYVDSPRFPQDFTAINTRVVARAPSEFEQQIVVTAGSGDGVRLHDPVVTADGLVGNVTLVAGNESSVTLLTDSESAAAAIDLQTRAVGLVRPGEAGNLIFDRVSPDQRVNVGDTIVTAGTQSAALPDLYPRGISIGKVTSVGQSDTDVYKRIQLSPFVQFGSLDSVVVLRSTRPGSSLP